MSKNILRLFFSMLLITLTILSGCKSTTESPENPDDEIISIEDREYEKIAHIMSDGNYEDSIEDFGKVYHKFPPITCYDDVVQIGKQLFYTTHGYEQTAPYMISYIKERDLWVYNSEKPYLYLDEFVVTDTEQYALISGNGELLWSVPELPENFEMCDAMFDTSNAFSFNFDDFKSFSGSSIYKEKLEKITCAEDVLDRVAYLYDALMLTDNGNCYYICYDEVNNYWLYDSWTTNGTGDTMTAIISGDGQIFLVDFMNILV